MTNPAIHWKIGIAAGLLFFLHALIPNSNAWPLIWQGMAAVVMVILLKRRGEAVDYKETAKKLFQTGLISSAIFFVGTALLLFTLSLPQMSGAGSFLGADGPLVFNAAAISGLLIAAGNGILVVLVIGSLIYLAAPRKIA